MSIGVNVIYSRVQAIANKEQRGYITPQEFNLLANQAQNEIFEAYFYELDRLNKLPGTSHDLTDRVEFLYQKIKPFQRHNQPVNANSLPADIYRLDTVYWNRRKCQRLTKNEYQDLVRYSPLLKPTKARPVFHFDDNNGNKIKVYNPQNITTKTTCDYVRKPAGAEWAYVVTQEKPLYHAGNSTNFELHGSEKPELVYRILELAGITIAKPGLAQLGDQMEKEMTASEKQ
tara:strand:+ start:1054 stop:1743 length:690 start_codon:yes stop_codon:yes gene_type:complete